MTSFEQHGDLTVIRYLTEEQRWLCRCQCGEFTVLTESAILLRKRCQHDCFAGLSNAETKIARLVAQGKANKEIAHALTISTRTVQTHLSNIFAKLDLRSRTEVAIFITQKSKSV